PAPPAPLVRDAPPRRRRRSPRCPGDARPRRPRHDRALHARIRSAAARVVLPSAPACAPESRNEEVGHAPRYTGPHRRSHDARRGVADDGRGCREEHPRTPSPPPHLPVVRERDRRACLRDLYELALLAFLALELLRDRRGGSPEV